MYKILKAETLADKIFLMDVEAPRVAKHCEPGQFVIVKMDEKGERIPLTICDYDREAGTVTIVFQIVGASTEKKSSATPRDTSVSFKSCSDSGAIHSLASPHIFTIFSITARSRLCLRRWNIIPILSSTHTISFTIDTSFP